MWVSAAVTLLVTPEKTSEFGVSRYKVWRSRKGVPVESPITEATFRSAFEVVARERIEALIVQDSMENLAHHKLIVELVRQARIPAIYPYPDFTRDGGRITLACDLFELYRHAAHQIDHILKGVPVRDIPFYQSTKFQLLLNVNTASDPSIGLPPSLLARADEVIE
jgi:putative ABC transport system substrate-binding protein